MSGFRVEFTNCLMRGYVRIIGFLIALGVCISFQFGCEPLPKQTAEVTSAQEASMTLPAIDSAEVVLFLGNIAAGFGVDRSEAVPALIQETVDSMGLEYKLINAGLSDETTEDGKSRINFLLKQNIRIFVLELGLNDQLSNIPPEETRNNLQQIIDEVNKRLPDVQILLCGFSSSAFADEVYATQLRGVYDSLSIDNDLAYLPNILEGLDSIPDGIQADGIHPTASGNARIAKRVWGKLEHFMAPVN